MGFVPAPPFIREGENQSELSALLDHVNHMVSVMGEEGVGLGMDFDELDDMQVAGLEDVSRLSNLTKGLSERGCSSETTARALGGNLLRIFAQVLL